MTCPFRGVVSELNTATAATALRQCPFVTKWASRPQPLALSNEAVAKLTGACPFMAQHGGGVSAAGGIQGFFQQSDILEAGRLQAANAAQPVDPKAATDSLKWAMEVAKSGCPHHAQPAAPHPVPKEAAAGAAGKCPVDHKAMAAAAAAAKAALGPKHGVQTVAGMPIPPLSAEKCPVNPKEEFNYESFFGKGIDNLKSEGRYRVFQYLQRQVGKHPKVKPNHGQGGEVTIWCSNDYLGMGHHPNVLLSMANTLMTNGAGAGGTRNIAGSSVWHGKLERELASLHNKGGALLFQSCYVANDSTLAVLGKMLPKCVIFSDESNHASLIEGIRHSGASKMLFRHNDAAHLDELMSKHDRGVPKIVVFESVYSMCGSIAPLKQILDVCDKHGAYSFLDEVHAVGLYGKEGGGVAQRDGLQDRVSVISGTLGKAFGVGGGYIAGSEKFVDLIRSTAPGFIFSTAVSPVVAAGALAAVQHLRNSQTEREQMRTNADKLKKMFREHDIPLLPSVSHILPVIIGDPVLTKRVTDTLIEEFGIFIQPINYPTVPRGTERLRITASPCHTEEDMRHLVTSLLTVFQRFNVPTRTAEELAAIKA